MTTPSRAPATVTLFQLPTRAWGSPNLSPFCTKLETYLRIAEIPYELGTLTRSAMPKGKIPYVELDGTLIGDSQLIIERLEARLVRDGKPSLDGDLSPRDAAIGHAVRRMLEEAFYFVSSYVRWEEPGYDATRDAFKQFVPGLVVPLIRRDIKKKLHAQGTGRHTPDEIMAMGRADMTAVSALLGDQPFVLGDRPRVVDCTVFAFVEGILGFPVDSPVKAAVQQHANLVAYRDRIRARWWSDLTSP
ncbi:MAG TPA: glutathione S-transferase family protein [Kofleriaceae bacterium]|nr:glutathione S-transferase family protein [Kofleriaceae bacterium]